MVGCDAPAHQAEGRGEPIEEVDLDDELLVFEERSGGIEARRSCTDDGDPEGSLRGPETRIGHVFTFLRAAPLSQEDPLG